MDRLTFKETTNEKIITKAEVKKLVYPVFKRIFDICVGLVGVICLVPLMLVLKIANLLVGDKGKLIYTQERIGLRGKTFKLYKFRSMVENADEILAEMLKDEEVRKEFEVKMKFENDPRITKVGRVIRKLSIDETPQFINILKGDMHLIGNRPYLPREIEDMGSYYKDIVKTKPGLTGYWQVNGRSNTTFKRRLQLENEYSNKANLWLDTKIFFKSLPTIILCRGAE